MNEIPDYPTFQAVRVLAVRETVTASYAGRIRGGADVRPIFEALVPAGETREHFVAVYLDGRNQVAGAQIVSIGTLNAAVAHPREIFRPAILVGAAQIIIAHQHPSGDPSPSAEDFAVTSRIREAGKLIGIPLLDHVIFGEIRYFSFLERGYMTDATGGAQ